MVHLKTCPKCRGDMCFQTDLHGAFWQCLQCGLLRDLAPATVQGKSPVQRKGTVQQVAS